ncbi:MAG: ATP-binding protein [Bacteroidota bacterium]
MAELNILVVDDEPGILSGIRIILDEFSVGYPFLEEDFTFHTLESETAEDALKFIENKKPDIILLDNKLPGMDGIDLLEHINEWGIDIPVMMITSYASLDLAVRATKNGAYNFLTKPFTPQELKSAVENITKHLFLKRMTQKLNKEEKQIRFQFLSVLSHELKSPLNAVEEFQELILTRQSGNKLENYDPIVKRSIERLKAMRRLIHDLLDLTKIESGSKSRELRPLNLIEIAKKVINLNMPIAEAANIQIYSKFPDKLNFTADDKEMEIVFNNLISNAIKYNKEKGSVNIEIISKPKEIIVSIEDTGIGMTEEEASKIFRDFIRIKNVKTRNIPGSGLGLSITKKIISLYDGKINLSSKVDKGSKFTICFPLEVKN